MDGLKFTKNQHGQLQALRDGKTPLAVKPTRCFPWSELNHYISIRDMQNEEVALIRGLDELENESRQAVSDALNESAFVFEIKRIVDIQIELEIRAWRVVTEQGDYSFQTKLDEWPIKLQQGKFIIKDVAGNLYSIADVECLDETSKRFLWAYLD